MTPSARLQAAIDIAAQLQSTQQPADRLLKDWARANRFAGSKDRAAIAERIFTLLRHPQSFAWRMGGNTGRNLVIASLLAEGVSPAEIEALFDGTRYAPEALSEAEKQHIASPPQSTVPSSVQGEYPAFLEADLTRAFGSNLLVEMQAFTTRAPVDLRVNTLKATRDEVLAQLLADEFEAAPTPFSPLGIRIPSGLGLSALSRHPLFEDGAFEFQDEAAQIAALLARPRARERVLDLAAGAGGKSLAFAAEMDNQGDILACDIDGKRLFALEPRAKRAGASIIRSHVLRGEPPDEQFDLVFVDAPCSGTGVWRRQPELRTRLTESRLAELASLQDRLLDQGAARLSPGGRLVYATCSILPRENEDRVAAFCARNPGFTVRKPAGPWAEISPQTVLPGPDDFFRASPYVTGTDGFFAAILVRGEA